MVKNSSLSGRSAKVRMDMEKGIQVEHNKGNKVISIDPEFPDQFQQNRQYGPGTRYEQIVENGHVSSEGQMSIPNNPEFEKLLNEFGPKREEPGVAGTYVDGQAKGKDVPTVKDDPVYEEWIINKKQELNTNSMADQFLDGQVMWNQEAKEAFEKSRGETTESPKTTTFHEPQIAGAKIAELRMKQMQAQAEERRQRGNMQSPRYAMPRSMR